ncbi:hypothetical protein DACRYDRAFT_96576 [Dacryopinax primogenitus]|uniref:Conserved oligomeric Golgi complex subunit 5 n=1 Tax=Dacryopinax primogenitus (strain DJM 731) TaxID=1858805 RepID=M5FXX5_DACPD|nr:uncharacterized protein DACRYDRAFT_96576 [Dacryopinax primogenitus]EJT98396.1 hypothetical protein DACRYDRAFT_96576 [Dacryopinax primogenitus]
MSADAPVDYDIFAHPSFDSNEYANAILARESYNPSSSKPKPSTTIVRGAGPISSEAGKEDISLAIAKLNFAIDDVAKQLQNVVVTHHEALLAQASTVTDLERAIGSVRHGLEQVETSLDRLKNKIQLPHATLSAHVVRLQRLQLATDVLRRTSRFIIIARRLEVQMAEVDAEPSHAVNGSGAATEVLEGDKERAIAKAALSIAELVSLYSAPSVTVVDQEGDSSTSISTATPRVPLSQVRAVSRHIAQIESHRIRVTSSMETMVSNGLLNLDQSLLASSLQTAYNLGVLPKLVQNLMADLTGAVDERIRSAFDVNRISRETAVKEAPTSSVPSLMYKSRIRTEPTQITAPQWTQALWSRLDLLIEDMASCCIKVYTLEKVLQRKRDPATGVVFLDEGMKLLENKPSSTFWMSLSQAIEKHTRENARNSTFLQQTLSTSYPRFLRLFHDFFAKIAVHTDTVYTLSQQSPETVLILRSISQFETLYLSRSTVRLNEAVSAVVANKDATLLVRTIANELDKARFDPLLVRSVARNVVGSLDNLIMRLDGQVIKDRLATSLQGPGATIQQIGNAQVISTLYQTCVRLRKLQDEFHESVWTIVEPSTRMIQAAYQRAVEPLLSAIRRETAAIIARLHRVDYGKPFDATVGGASSVYMDDLITKLTLVRTDILPRFDVGELRNEWIMQITKHVLKHFVLHASIASPLGEGGKLQLTSDMTQLEFALNQFVSSGDGSGPKRGSRLRLENAGDDFRALRGLRPLLFLDPADLTSPAHTAGLPPLIVLHHILVLSPLPMPHTTNGWTEAEYVRWVDTHAPSEACDLVEACLGRGEKNVAGGFEKAEREKAQGWVELARTVLAHSRDPHLHTRTGSTVVNGRS